ncbi:MAG: hypothetical protein PHY73_00645 [Candidatus Omnitrophica bacterium]|nr:hypothetical protein [Candidatus Omnitrophota bacterium]
MILICRKLKNKKAQSILELAIYGGLVLMFLGVVIRYAMSFADSSNAQFGAMHKALELSGRSLSETGSVDGSVSRSHASVLWINDKPTLEGGAKYGSSSSTPSMASGGGTFSNLLNYSLEYGENENLPVTDIYINGQHFVFRTAGFRTYGKGANGVSYDSSQTVNMMGGDGVRLWDLCPGENNSKNCLSKVPHSVLDEWKEFAWFSGWLIKAPQLVFYTKIAKTNKKFCYSQWDPWKPDFSRHCGDDPSNEELKHRFNLKMEDPAPSLMSKADRYNMEWQWFPVHASLWGIQPYKDGAQTVLDVDFDKKEEQILTLIAIKGCGGNIMLESTYNLLEPGEYGDALWPFADAGICMVVTQLKVLDYQAGDLDMTYDTADKVAGKPSPGLVSDQAKITTFSSGQLIVDQEEIASGSIEKKTRQTQNSLDIIERKIQLSNNTGCFCPKKGLIGAGGCYSHAKDDVGYGFSEKPDYCSSDNLSVEMACNTLDCCDGDAYNAKYKTCFDYGTNILYVRTVMEDRKGVKFITQD